MLSDFKYNVDINLMRSQIMRYFDLNIEKVLESWTNADAIREIIANALDEKRLTNTEDISIFKDNNCKWHIVDFGRGIQSKHFTQNENLEKQNVKNMIGKFGVGLKDALGVLYNNGINVTIDSKFGHITLQMFQKEGFNVKTLHAVFDEPYDRDMVGTEFVFEGLKDDDVELAKRMFLVFNDEKILESTKYGEVYLRPSDHAAYIYINGVRVAEEDNFLFSYNITELNAKIRKALNRERSNVGRSAYTDAVKKILLSSESESVSKKLLEDVDNLVKGNAKDESTWVDVTSYAIEILDKKDDCIFMTPDQRNDLTNQEVEILRENGKQLVLVPNTVMNKIGEKINTFDNVKEEYKKAFEYSFVDVGDLSYDEKRIFSLTEDIKRLFKAEGYKTDIPVLVSEKIRIDFFGEETNGVYERDLNGERIIIKRKILKDERRFCGTLAHELCHYQHGHEDNTRNFENDLTDVLGDVIAMTLHETALQNNVQHQKKEKRSWLKRLFDAKKK